MFVKIMLIVVLTSSIGFVYWRLYYKRLNVVIADSQIKLYKIPPLSFSIGLLTITFICIISISIVKVFALEAEISEMQEIIIEDHYRDLSFPNDAIEETYVRYNNFFGGYYRLTNGEYILCITKDAPNGLKSKLEESSQKYVLVNYNYSELLQLHQMIINEYRETHEISLVYVDEVSNSVYVGVRSPDFDSTMLDNYISNEMLVIEVVETIVTK